MVESCRRNPDSVFSGYINCLFYRRNEHIPCDKIDIARTFLLQFEKDFRQMFTAYIFTDFSTAYSFILTKGVPRSGFRKGAPLP